ncbi:MAG: SDR family oxidoreductase [Acuticoccus sp.]
MIPNGSYAAAPGPLPATALVTGGAGALGVAIANAIAPGRRVALIDIGEHVHEVAATLPDAIAFAGDLSSPDTVRDLYAAAFETLGPIGIVVHCAGFAPVAPFLETDRATFEEALNVNLLAGFDLFRYAALDLIAQGHAGRFVSISSISGARAGYARTAYGTSKAALIHLAGQMALELGPYGITSNTVAPGPVDTPLSRERHTAEARADYQRTIPMARYGEAEEIARAVAFLTAEESSYISGQTLFIDGGYMAAGMGVTTAQSAAAIRRVPATKDDQ